MQKEITIVVVLAVMLVAGFMWGIVHLVEAKFQADLASECFKFEKKSEIMECVEALK